MVAQPEASALEKILGHRVDDIAEVSKGGNSKVYRINCGTAGQFAVKVGGSKGRLAREYSASTFLWEHGIRRIPRPIAIERSAGWVVYDFAEGCHVAPRSISNVDIFQAVDFLASLRRLATVPAAQALPDASEACFSMQSIIDSIRSRLRRFDALSVDGALYNELKSFLANECRPRLVDVADRCRSETQGGGFTQYLAHHERTLSPSDFGFHNALRNADGRWTFLDFEHFGWDDPAKLIADFLLHPHEKMDIDRSLKAAFLSAIVGRLSDTPEALDRRVELVLPLFALKWCMILLNEFIPGDLRRREAAIGGCTSNRNGMQRAQLKKAKAMLEKCRTLAGVP